METDIESELKLKKLEEEIQLLKKDIQKSKHASEFPKTFFNKLLILILLGSLISILLFLSSMVVTKFSFMYGIGFFIISITIFRIVAAEWKNDLLLPAYIFFSSAILAFSSYIFFYNSENYGLDKMLIWLLLVVVSSYFIIYWIDEVYRKLKINLINKTIDKKFAAITVLLPLLFFILYTYMSNIIVLFDTHPWLATVVMVAISVLTTYVLARKKEIKGEIK